MEHVSSVELRALCGETVDYAPGNDQFGKKKLSQFDGFANWTAPWHDEQTSLWNPFSQATIISQYHPNTSDCSLKSAPLIQLMSAFKISLHRKIEVIFFASQPGKKKKKNKLN